MLEGALSSMLFKCMSTIPHVFGIPLKLVKQLPLDCIKSISSSYHYISDVLSILYL